MATPCGFICAMKMKAGGGIKFRVKLDVYFLLSKGKLFAPHLEEICSI